MSTLNLDAKGRVAIPAKHREALQQARAGRVVVTVNPSKEEKCLLLYSEQEWRELMRRLSRQSSMNPVNRAIQRLVVGYASELELDSQGRILIASELREFAGLDKKILFIGQTHKIEIWDEQSWHASQERFLDLASGGLDGSSPESEGMSL